MIKDGDKTFASVHVIFIDKNHPASAIQKTVDMIKDNAPQSAKVIKLYLIPRISQPMTGYPFSASFFL